MQATQQSVIPVFTVFETKKTSTFFNRSSNYPKTCDIQVLFKNATSCLYTIPLSTERVEDSDVAFKDLETKVIYFAPKSYILKCKNSCSWSMRILENLIKSMPKCPVSRCDFTFNEKPNHSITLPSIELYDMVKVLDRRSNQEFYIDRNELALSTKVQIADLKDVEVSIINQESNILLRSIRIHRCSLSLKTNSKEKVNINSIQFFKMVTLKDFSGKEYYACRRQIKYYIKYPVTSLLEGKVNPPEEPKIPKVWMEVYQSNLDKSGYRGAPSKEDFLYAHAEIVKLKKYDVRNKWIFLKWYFHAHSDADLRKILKERNSLAKFEITNNPKDCVSLAFEWFNVTLLNSLEQTIVSWRSEGLPLPASISLLTNLSMSVLNPKPWIRKELY